MPIQFSETTISDHMSMPPISDERLRTVCKIGQREACCRYITCGQDGFQCAKGAELAAEINRRVEAGRMVARGDNCPGLKH